jgi:hypothetical protein
MRCWLTAFCLLGLAGLVWIAAWTFLSQEGAAREPAAAGAEGRSVSYTQLLSCRTMVGNFIATFVAYWALAMLIYDTTRPPNG